MPGTEPAAGPYGVAVQRPLFAIVLVLGAYLSLSFVDTGVKWLALAGLPALQLAFMRYFGHFTISCAVLIVSREKLPFGDVVRPGLGLLRAALLAASTVLNFIALKSLSLPLNSTILFLAPIIVCILSWPLLGEKVGPWRTAAVVIGFIGVMVAIRPFSESFDWAALFALGAATCFAFYTILTRMLSGKLSIRVMQFHSGLVGTVLLFPFALLYWERPENIFDTVVMIAIGGFAWLGHEFLTRAYGFTEASNLVPFSYSFIVYLTLWSILLFGQIPIFWTILGGVIVTISGLTIWAREVQRARRSKPAATPPLLP